MDVDGKINLLRQHHHKLEAEIKEENTRPLPDDLKVATLKKEKLRIKDEIQQLEAAH